MKDQPTLEELLRMQVSVAHSSSYINISPEFRIAVQRITEDGVRIIIHANGHDSDTCDFIVKNDELTALFND